MKGSRWAASAVTGVLSPYIGQRAPAGVDADAFRQRLCSASDLSDVLRDIINEEWGRRVKVARTFWTNEWNLGATQDGVIPAAVRTALPNQLPPKEALKGDSKERVVAQFVARLRITSADKRAATKIFTSGGEAALAYVPAAQSLCTCACVQRRHLHAPAVHAPARYAQAQPP